jgi:hypothetical protein
MTRITIFLLEDERRALLELSEEQKRPPKEQAAWLLREQLKALGALKADNRPIEVQHAAD